MKFTIGHTRALAGNDVSVKVEADGDKAIQSVLTKLDGFELADDELENPSDSYERAFPGAGTAGPGYGGRWGNYGCAPSRRRH